MMMPGRGYTAGSSYRYGFNGKENDNEVKGDGSQQDYGFRIYDTRLGKFLSVDPLTKSYPMLTPYQYASNSPIAGIDQDGLEMEAYWVIMFKTWVEIKLNNLKSEAVDGLDAMGRLSSGASGKINAPENVNTPRDPVSTSVNNTIGTLSDLSKTVNAISLPYQAANFGVSVVVPEAGFIMGAFDFYQGNYISGTIGMLSFGFGTWGRTTNLTRNAPLRPTIEAPKFNLGGKNNSQIGIRFSTKPKTGNLSDGAEFLDDLRMYEMPITKATIPLTKKTFGHTFATHGENMTDFLVNRAAGSGMPQGQFLDNQKAAQFILDNIGKTSNGAVNIPIPKGFPARIVMPDGTFKSATHIRLVPSGSGVKTAYPLNP